MRTIRCGLSAALSVCVALSAAAEDADGGQRDDKAAMNDRAARSKSQASKTLEEIVVTATKREENLQNVPISIAVLSGDQLDRSTIPGQVVEELRTVPGVYIAPLINDSISFTVRGVHGDQFGEGSVVGYYLDTVPFGLIRRGTVPDAGPYDLERLEVLKGPQGTLYGAASLNGVVRLLTHDADVDDFAFKARAVTSATKDGGTNYGGDMAVNVPIVEGKLAARAVGSYQDLSGWIDKPDRKDSNDRVSSTLRLKVNAKPTDNLSVSLSAWSSDVEGRSGLADYRRQNPLARDEPRVDDFDTYGATVGYVLPWFSVTSMTGYLEARNMTNSDTAPFGIAGSFRNDQDSKVLSQEFVLTSNTEGAWKWTLGAMYRDAEERLLQRFLLDTGAVNVAGDDVSTSTSYAAYGEITRSLMGGRLDVTAGVRYFEDEVTLQYRPRFAGDPSGGFGDTVDNVSPRVVLTGHVTKDLLLYASYAEGFRSGVPQHPGPFRSLGGIAGGVPPVLEPDTLTNYELGSKGSLFGGVIEFDTAVYYQKWENKPLSRVVRITVNDLTFPTPVLANGEPLEGIGVDLGMTFRPTDSIRFRAAFSWNDLEFEKDAADGRFKKGQRPPLSPDIGFNAEASYLFPVGGQGLKGQFSASVNHNASAELNRLETDPLWIARIGLSVQDSDHWSATLFVDNLTDWNGSTFFFENFPESHQYYNHARVRPRTIGVQVDYNF